MLSAAAAKEEEKKKKENTDTMGIHIFFLNE